MTTWNQLFLRHGWLLEEKEKNVFDCARETEENLGFLLESLNELGINYQKQSEQLILPEDAISEKEWIQQIDFYQRGVGEGLWFESTKEEPKVRGLDTYIVGIVRQFNRLGFHTTGSCDGHGQRAANVAVTKEANLEKLNTVLEILDTKRIRYRENRNNHQVYFHVGRNELLDIAEKVSTIDKTWLVYGKEYIKEQLFFQTLEDLLSIPGESESEVKIREFVKEKLSPLVDHITTDQYGNLLAEKTYRSGSGPTILINAHLDVASEIESSREIIKHENIWSSSKGILGADDRAGVAVILTIAERLLNSSFSGKVKYIFTVEEEIGLRGARNINEYFLWGTDAAIVIDRRGTGDIITSCGGYIPFCDERYGEFIENIATEEGLTDWACTTGGSSDTRIWAEYGIQSVNLSVGYWDEHTDAESLDIEAAYETVKLVEGIFSNVGELRRVLRSIHRVYR